MTKVEAIIQPAKFEAVKSALSALGIEGMTAMDVRGHGLQNNHTESYRGHEYSVGFLPRIKIDLVLPADLVDAGVDASQHTASTGAIGDGKIFLSKLDQAVRIRNQQIGTAAL